MAQIMNGHSSEGVTLNQVPSTQYHHYHHHYTPPTELADYNFFLNGLTNGHQEKQNDGHVTVVQVEQQQKQQQQCQSVHNHPDPGPSLPYKDLDSSDFVTVLRIASTGATVMTNSTINSLCPMTSSSSTSNSSSAGHGSSQKIFVDNRRGEIEEEVIIYRLPGERLGMALRFDGGQSANECIRRVFVQNISPNSPSSKAIGLMLGMLREGDEIMQIDGRVSSSLTRLECITLLRDAPVCIRLLVRRCLVLPGPSSSNIQHCCSVPNQSQPYMATCYCQNELPNEQSQHSINSNSQLSQPNYPLSPSNTPMLSQLLQSCQTEQSTPKKIPPPVPPRMATTTLSAKRRSRPEPIVPREEPGPVVSETQLSINEGNNAPVAQLEEAGETQAIPVEKPPRRKNQNSGNPPPLPPRRPKGPPPKPPVDRVSSSVVMSSVTITSTSITTAVTRTLPSLVTVITTSKVSDVTTSTKNNIMSTSSACNQTHSSSKSTHSTSMTSKVTFTISNSKVSSFIRQTAEKLHRKLSGKTTNQEEEDDSKNMHKSSSKILKTQVPERYRPVLHTTTSSSAITIEPESNSVEVIPPPVLYVDACQETEDTLCFESDTDDTGSSVSTIIERNPSSNSNRTESMLPSLEQSPYFSKAMLPERSDALIVDRVLSPFERLESELDGDSHLTGPFSLSAITRHMSSMPFEQVTNGPAYHSLSIVPNPVASVAHLLPPNKTQVLIADLQPSPINAQQASQIELPRSITKLDTDSQRSHLALGTIDSNSLQNCGGETPKKEFILPSPVLAKTEDNSNCEKETLNVDGEKVGLSNQNVSSDSIFDAELEEDEEDLAAIKNDIISRVDDDKDDFMLDNDYLNETSARFMFHHSGSELILGSYSELSSITEEDEEDSEVVECKTEENSKPEEVHHETNQTSFAEAATEIVSSIGQRRVVSNESIDSGLDHELCKMDLESEDAKLHSDSDVSEVKSSASDTSSLSSRKVRLDNVFDFLNKATDDFEFVERMLELTNDKIDSIDDIMRIRESLRGLQESEQRDNLQRFLDGKDVLDELMALSSHSNSPASSEGHQSPSAFDSGEEISIELARTRRTPPRSIPPCMDEFTSLPVTLDKSSNCFKETKLKGASKIPTLLPKPVLVPNQSDLGTLKKRSNSVSNIFNRTGGFNSLIELRPSLIPRPISNFNLELPPPPTNLKLVSGEVQRISSHNCLNRSTSMQSIFSTNLQSRSASKNKMAGRDRRLSVASGVSQGSTNYHQNCLRAEHQSSGPYYGSLSRNMSKSSHSVYSTGSLPRPVKNQAQRSPGYVQPLTTSHHYGNHFRTTSLTDLTYGLIAPKQQLPLANRPKHATPSQSNLASGTASRRHSTSSGNLLLCTDPLTSTSSREEEVCGGIVEHSECHNNRFGTASLESTLHKRQSGKLRTSTSLTSLVPSAQSSSSNHFWHCSHHNPTNKAQSKRMINTSSLVKTRPSQCFSTQLNGKTSKQSLRKSIKPVSSSSSTSSSSSNKSDSEESAPQTRSILRLSSTPKNKVKWENSQNFDYWNQNIAHKKVDYELSLYSDSESSDITISSGDSAEDKSDWQSKRRQHHKVCFVDEIIEHRVHDSTSSSSASISATESVMATAPGKPMGDENFYSSSPEVLPTLSSSTSTSSISSLGSSGEFSKPSTVETAALRHPAPEGERPHNGSKAFYLSHSSHREDSGIFASDDTSTSEFSQSPSPELIIGSSSNLEKSPDNQSVSVETSPSIKERIAFFDAPTNKLSMELNRSQSCIKQNGSTSSINHLLSRSSSAPYDCLSKMELLHLPSSKAEVMIKSYPSTTQPVMKSEITVYPVNLDLKKTNGFSMRDSFITARRHKNVCKLKGLIIPESLTTTEEVDSSNESQNAPEIDLPTIISEDILKIQGVQDEKCVAVVGAEQTLPPIEIIPLQSATHHSVPKYSPMFKRRPFSLPPASYEARLNGEADFDKKCHRNENTKQTKQAPIVPPKPKMANSTKSINEASSALVGEESEKVRQLEQLPPPPLPPKRKEINLNILNEEEHINQGTEQNESNGEVINDLENNGQQSMTPVCEGIQVLPVVRGGEMSNTQHEFVIYQKQYSMRAIIFEWDTVESMITLDGSDDIHHCASLGITLTGGIDSDSNEVIVSDIAENLIADRDGRLQRGDRIISINGKRLKGLTQKEIMEQLNVACATRKVVFVCSRPHDQPGSEQLTPPPVSSPHPCASIPIINTPSGDTTPLSSGKTIKAEITKDVTGLGFIIEGGKNSSFGDRPITIKRIFRGGPVDKEGSLVEGDELLLVNDHPIHEMTRAEAWNFLKQLPDGKVSLIARRRRYF